MTETTRTAPEPRIFARNPGFLAAQAKGAPA